MTSPRLQVTTPDILPDEPAADGGKRIVPDLTVLPFPFRNGDELLALCEREKTSVAGIMRRNERAWRSDAQIDAGLLRIWGVMQACVNRGCGSTVPSWIAPSVRPRAISGTTIPDVFASARIASACASSCAISSTCSCTSARNTASPVRTARCTG